jgi:hypothetical protein
MDHQQIQTEQTMHTVSTTDMPLEEFMALARNHTLRNQPPTRGFPPENQEPRCCPPSMYVDREDSSDMLTSETPSLTQVSTTARSPTALSTAAAASTLMSDTTPEYAVSYKKRRSSTGQSSSGDEAMGKQGGSAPPDKGAAARGAGTSYNRFNLLPLVNLDAQVTQKSSSDEAEDIPLIYPRIKDGTCKRKWKHSRLFPAQRTSSESAEELLRTATQQRSQDSYKMSKKAGDWTAKEWAMILGIKWPIKDINHMEFLPTDTGASHGRAGSMKKKSSSKSFTAEQWSKILWPVSQANKKLAKCRAMIMAWEEPKKSPQKPIKPKDQKPRSGVDQKSFDLASFIRTGKSMKEEQKCDFIQQSMTDESLGWMSCNASLSICLTWTMICGCNCG